MVEIKKFQKMSPFREISHNFRKIVNRGGWAPPSPPSWITLKGLFCFSYKKSIVLVEKKECNQFLNRDFFADSIFFSDSKSDYFEKKNWKKKKLPFNAVRGWNLEFSSHRWNWTSFGISDFFLIFWAIAHQNQRFFFSNLTTSGLSLREKVGGGPFVKLGLGSPHSVYIASVAMENEIWRKKLKKSFLGAC